MKFLGIDLGWRSGASGLCCLEWRNGQLRLLDLDRKEPIADILSWIDTWVKPEAPAIIAVDAPTLIPNATGMRLPDKLTHKYFGKYHAGCYPANLSLPFAQRTVDFGLALEARGFHHAPEIIPQMLGRYQIEVFPHPAIVHLFQLERILKYKKGKLAERYLELLKLRQHIVSTLSTIEPALILSQASCQSSEIPPTPLKKGGFVLPLTRNQAAIQFMLHPTSFLLQGAALKAVEDQLDSLICAYVAAYWWYWGLERNWVLGDRASGYIVVPAPLSVQAANLDSTGVLRPEN
jgi:predicted RNase H-like nuclease